MYPEKQTETYTLQDMMEDESPENPLDDALWQAFRGTENMVDLDANRRLIELNVDADAVLTVAAMQAYSQQISDIVEKMGAGKVEFAGIQGGVNMRISLVYRY